MKLKSVFNLKYLFVIIIILGFLISCTDQKKQDDSLQYTATPIKKEIDGGILNSEQNLIRNENKTESIMYYVRAHNYLDQKNYVNAEKHFDTVIKLEPDFARAWLGRANAKFYQGKYDSSLSDLDKSIELKEELGDAYLLKSIIFLNKGESEKAENQIVNFEELVSPEWSYLIKARINGERGNLEEADNLFSQSLLIASNPMVVYWWRAIFWANINELEYALNDFKQAILLDPNNPILYLDRAKVLIKNNQDNSIIVSDLEEAISLSKEPRLPHIYKEANKLLKETK